ncbi:MAG TPA: PIG-L deacetylase family protein [Chloroflexota bacterium]|nr:PIG-L deacetylase family protein [Chloroflexota bacterium]
MVSESEQQEELRRVMVIAAHPDDPEFGCAATIAKWAAMGREITYLLLTSGDKGCHDPEVRPGQIAARREEEQRAAAEVLGVKEVIYLNYPDGILENTLDLRRRLALILRERQPEIVVTIDPWRHYQLHPDHRAAGQAALDAIFAAREWYIFPEQLLGERQPWRVKEVYLFWSEAPDYWEDVTETVDRRIAALRCHVSQVGDRLERIAERVRDGLRQAAKDHGMEYAEAFKRIKL